MPLLTGVVAAAPTARQRQNFNGSVTSLVNTTSQLHDMQSDDFDVLHDRANIRRDEDDKLALVYVASGQVIGHYEGDTELVTRPGQLMLFDARRAHQVRFLQPHFVQVNLPRAYLQGVLSAQMLPSQVSRAVSSSGLAGLLTMQLAQFSQLCSTLDAPEQHALLQATESLATLVVETACRALGQDCEGRYYRWYVAAQQYIRVHLAQPHLNADSIALALGCSRATLYRAFTEQQLSLAEHIRELRLQALARILQQPANPLPIAQLAHNCGLHDAPNLSRAFRQRFGMTPQEFRAAYR